MKKILVINPNSNSAVTAGLKESLQPLQLPGKVNIECMTLAEGPFGIETRLDAESVVLPLRNTMLQRSDVDAFVIACYSDPGLALCREETMKPVFGIQESGLFAALQRGHRVGVIALSPKSIARHLPYISMLGLESRLAAERPLNLSVADSEEDTAYPKIEAVATKLINEDQADTILLGCAGMAKHCQKLQNSLNIPVTEPTQAAVIQALGTVLIA